MEDDEDSCELMRIFLKQAGYEIVTCVESEEGLKLARQVGFDVIIFLFPLKSYLINI